MKLVAVLHIIFTLQTRFKEIVIDVHSSVSKTSYSLFYSQDKVLTLEEYFTSLKKAIFSKGFLEARNKENSAGPKRFLNFI